MSDDTETKQVRSIFISDLHLGTRGAQAELVLDFLREYDAPRIYLVGDIIDGWRLKSGWYFPQSHNDVIQKLLRKVRKGSKLIYVTGNHDDFLRDFTGLQFGGITLVDEIVHQTADGKRMLVIHGDLFDLVVRNAKWLALLGDWAYGVALALNMLINKVRRRLHLPHWSLSAWAKLKVKNAVNYIGEFETCLASEARRHNADGVICGHIHHAADREIDGLRYINTGDWVESCTAFVEHHDGRFELIRWPQYQVRSEQLAPARKRPQPALVEAA
jgi:UDP-2,3-diacylglucosamine pyrophosphatase LpxH